MQYSVDDKMDLLERNHQVVEDLALNLSAERKRKVERGEVFWALFMLWGDRYGIEWAAPLWDVDINYSQAYEELKDFDFNQFDKEIETDFYLVEDIILFEKKAKIKASGAIWFIYKTDKDYFPSSPHAHCYEENIKLDLSNGNCYRNKSLLKTLKRRELIDIRIKAEQSCNYELPLLKT